MQAKDKDMFEELRIAVKCGYVSDLPQPPYRQRALAKLAAPDFTGYDIAGWQDILRYLEIPGGAQVCGENQAKALAALALREK